MFTTGSKLLIGAAVLAAVGAIVYGVTQDGVQGTIGLVSAAVALSFIAGVNVWARDSNLSAMDTIAVQTSEAADETPPPSVWPMLFAVGAVAVVLGLVSQPSIFIIGLVILLASGAQWMVQAWAEAAAGPAEIRASVRERVAEPLEFPLLGAVAVGAIAYAMSRVMLWLSKTNTVIAFATLATIVALVAFFFAYRPSVKRGAIGGVLAVGAIVVVAGGVAAGVDGERDIHEHETASELALTGFCESPDEEEADEDASQTVANKASTITVTLTADERLEFDVPGPIEDGAIALSLPRSNPNNIVFRNESDHERRLSVDLGALSEEEIAAIAEESDDESHGDDSHDGDAEPFTRRQVCTPLVNSDGASLLTLLINEPTVAVADDPLAHRFFVPGTDAELELFVP